MTSPLYVALDTPDLSRATDIVERARAHIGGLKLGLEFFAANGPGGVRQVASLGLPIFLDLKLHDIPNTVASAIQALGDLEPAVLTVHAAGGRAMLEDAKAAAHPSTKVVAVTMLTSLDAADLAATGIGGSAHAQVARLADLAAAAGIDGIVCSGEEVAAAKKCWRQGFFVVPGLRLDGADPGAFGADQKRVVTPRAALDAGASILVIGRPITRAEDPDAAARAIGATL